MLTYEEHKRTATAYDGYCRDGVFVFATLINATLINLVYNIAASGSAPS